MAKLLIDGGRWSVAESWRTIRTVRADIPARFAKTLTGERKAVFHTALEQAQQQFAAAANIGYESRSLNLFYGLAQAGRALAACSDSLRKNHGDEMNKQWQGKAHGLSIDRTIPANKDVWHVRLAYEPNPLDSFSRASIALNSPTDMGSAELGALAAQLPEFTTEFRGFKEWATYLPLSNGIWNAPNGHLPATLHLGLWGYDGSIREEEIRTYLDRYPVLEGLELRASDDGSIYTDQTPPIPYVIIPPERVHIRGDRIMLNGEMTYVAGLRMASATIGQSSEAMQPLAVWWSILFAFSILARYHPKAWTEILSLTTNPAASEVEFLLDAAVASVPELLARHLSRTDG